MACQYARTFLRPQLWQQSHFIRLPSRSLKQMSQRGPRASPRHSQQQYRRPEPARPVYEEQESAYTTMMNNTVVNTRFANGCIFIACGIYLAWNWAEGGLTFKMYDKFQREQGPRIKSVTGIALPSPNNKGLVDFMRRWFTFDSSSSLLDPSWIGASLSHNHFAHAFFNLYTWHSVATHMLGGFPPVHVIGLTVGSALAAFGAWRYFTPPGGKNRNALGSSGIVSGFFMTATCLAPMARVSLMFLIPMPLIVATAGYFAADTYFLLQEQETGIGHAAHIGGAVFGAAYYMVFFRRFGGVLGRSM